MSTAAYADLVFAWAHARLGDREPATALAASATATLTEGADPAHDWAAAAFRHRIGQALRGRPHAGGWPPDLADALDHVDDDRGIGMSRLYVVNRLRQRSRVLEPDRRLDPYTHHKRS